MTVESLELALTMLNWSLRWGMLLLCVVSVCIFVVLVCILHAIHRQTEWLMEEDDQHDRHRA